MPLRDTERFCLGTLAYLRSRITLGTGKLICGVRTKVPEFSSTSAAPNSTRRIARRAAQTLIASYEALRTRVARLRLMLFPLSRDSGLVPQTNLLVERSGPTASHLANSTGSFRFCHFHPRMDEPLRISCRTQWV